MIKDKYFKQIAATVKHLTSDKNVKLFLFGSSVRKNRFGDCDIGIMGDVSAREIRKIKQVLGDSTLPYKVDVINFNNVSDIFRNAVLKKPIIWIKH